MAKKNENYYFTSFAEMVQFSCDASLMIREVVNNYNYDDIQDLKIKIHHIEHSADIRKHILLEKLAKEFITPIETEDIIQIAQRIDDVTDSLEDILLRLYMYNVKTLREDVIPFSEITYECTLALKEALEQFANFKKPERLKQLIVQVNHLEEKADDLYIDSIHRLFSECNDSVQLFIWEDLYNRFENVCDACEDVADIIEAVIMKNA